MNKTFDKGLQILEAIQLAGQHGLDMAALARETGIQRSTVYRYVKVLHARGYVHFPRRPSVAVALGADQRSRRAGRGDAQIVPAFAPVLRRISDATGDASFLVRAEQGDSLCLHRELGVYPVQVLAVTIGHRQPLGVGAAGLALLASQHDADIDAILTRNASRLAQFGGMTRARMEQLIHTTRERGWSAVGNAAVPGVLGVGLPVPGPGARAHFAVSVSSIMSRMPLARQRFIVDVMRHALAGVAIGQIFAGPHDSR